MRVAFIVSHPIQYYAPLYKRLARRGEIEIKVFFTWHGGTVAVKDKGFGQPIAWDVPLVDGYDHEAVENGSSDPGTHHFMGLRNPTLMDRVIAWRPDVAHVTGWAWCSHLLALKALRRRRIPSIFRGDSHLLDEKRHGLRWQTKKALLGRIFKLPSAFLAVGRANVDYFTSFGVDRTRLHLCPHSIDVPRFAGDHDSLEHEARKWRTQLGIRASDRVLLYAGKFERKKRPLELMDVVAAAREPDLVLIMIGSGELGEEVRKRASASPSRFRVLPFQNQSRMPIAYRLGDVFVLPSSHGETWGLAVNEALACGRPVIVSDRVGCAADVVDQRCGRIFAWQDMHAVLGAVHDITSDRVVLALMSQASQARAWDFDTSVGESRLMSCLRAISEP